MSTFMQKTIAATVALGMAALLASGFSAMQNPLTIASAQAAEVPAPADSARLAQALPAGTETVVFAGGCFWGVQGVFQHVKGVTSAVSGYTGGNASTARYDIVSNGNTGHAESVKVTFDPRQVSYARLMQVFFSVVHDPTELNYQGPDHGTQYRSAIFTSTPEQYASTQAYVAQLDKTAMFKDRIVTKVERSYEFYPAERYHQDYLTLNPQSSYIRAFDLPKVADLKRLYPTLYREQPVLVTRR
ncbi:MAG: peptide-methionine (S)-S-oxide reductase MsrA [Pseudoxanthomonas sp.]